MLLFLAFLGARPAIADDDYKEVPTFAIYCGLTRNGSGFIANWQGKKVLVTALHVIWNCSSISMTRTDSAESLWTFHANEPGKDNGEPITAWYQYDIATIPVPNSLNVPGLDRGIPVIDEGAGIPRWYSTLAVLGLTINSENPRGVGTLIDDDSAYATMKFIGQKLGMQLQEALGSLSGNVRFMHYFGTGAPGGSGGPVTLPGQLKVLAMHEGGNGQNNTSWGVRFWGLKDSAHLTFHFGAAWPPEYRKPIKGQSIDNLPSPPSVEDSLRRAAWHFFVGVGLSFESPVTHSPKLPNMWLNAFIMPDLATGLGPNHDRSVEIRIAGGPMFGELPQTLTGPDGTPLEHSDVWGESGKTWLLEVAIQSRFLRFSRFRPSLDFPAIRAGWMEFDNPNGVEQTQPIVGVPIRGRISMSLSRFNAIFLEAIASYEWRPEATYQYNAIGGGFSGPTMNSSLNLGVGVGYEH